MNNGRTMEEEICKISEIPISTLPPPLPSHLTLTEFRRLFLFQACSIYCFYNWVVTQCGCYLRPFEPYYDPYTLAEYRPCTTVAGKYHNVQLTTCTDNSQYLK